MNIAIIQFPGSNCEAESARAIAKAGMTPVPFLWNQPARVLEHCDGYFIVGGFSYEDRSRAGIIAAMDPIMKVVREESLKGKPVLGICNGAQVLVETGMVPGLPGERVGMSLATNKRIKDGNVVGTGFYNTWVNMRVSAPAETTAFTLDLEKNHILRVPIAHAEGRFVMDNALLKELKQNNQTTFQYCDADGNVTNNFPINPNGAAYNLAAVSNNRGNVMAMMPHPERTNDGNSIFTSMRKYIQEKNYTLQTTSKTLTYKPSRVDIATYIRPESNEELATSLIITDNEARTVETALQKAGVNAKIKRYTHWQATCDQDTLKQIIDSGELYNSNKEKEVELDVSLPHTVYLLIRDKEDVHGQQKKQVLVERFGLDKLTDLRRGTIWKISLERGSMDTTLEQILRTHILFNPFSQDCFIYTHSKRTPKPQTTMHHKNAIKEQLTNCLTETNLDVGKKYQGKVRDTYELEDKLILITTDRQSAFDRVLASIPFKGQVLNLTSAWWFEKTKHIINNHVLSIPDPNVTVAKRCTVFPVEFVVRGYITGTTSTSAWVNYQNGVRDFCGNRLPEGLRKNQKFDQPIITPTTKDVEHDRSISPQEIVAEGLMTREEWDYVSRKALALFKFGQRVAAEHGLILVDTKYEFGKDANDNIVLLDEIHTPDSSRYWIAKSYKERFAAGQEPENIDKEFLRLWFKDNSDPYNDAELPPAPEQLVVELSRRYIMLYEMITGQRFQFPKTNTPVEQRIQQNLQRYAGTSSVIASEAKQSHTTPSNETIHARLPRRSPELTPRNDSEALRVVLILGSTKDEPHAKKITDELDQFGIHWDQYVASAHKQAPEAMQILAKYKDKKVIYVTLAGRSNALSGFVAGNSNKPTIACPPFKDKMDMFVNIHSTIQMPSKVPVMTILEPSNVALAIKRLTDM